MVLLFLFIVIVILGWLFLVALAGGAIDKKCPPYHGMTKKEEKEYLKQFIKNNPEYAEEDCLLL